MGVGFSHGNAGWGYGSFHRFRNSLAKQIGIDNLFGMAGFGGSVSWDTVNDPIKPFLDHSDCDGELSPEECGMIYPRIIELVSSWPDDDEDKETALELAEGMRMAAEAGEVFEFR